MKKLTIPVSVLLLILFVSLVSGSTDTTDTNGLMRDMKPVTGGRYIQKSTDGESFLHTISDFSIGKYEVTYDLWYDVYKWSVNNGYHFANRGREGSHGIDGAYPTDNRYHPVTMINWRDCVVWCNAYSEMMGFIPVYKSGGAVLKDSRDSNFSNCDNATCDWSANGYRLPTEGEWQFAASDCDNVPYNYVSGATHDYENKDACEKVAWYGTNSDFGTHPVGEKQFNYLDLYDMSGNVWEWCWDIYDFYPSDSTTDYRGAVVGSNRVLRGGGWSNDADYLQVGYRVNSSPHYEYFYAGFRLVRCPS